MSISIGLTTTPMRCATWTDEDWQGIQPPRLLGYNTVMIWTMSESMPARHTASDQAYLQKIGRVIDFAHGLGTKSWWATRPTSWPRAAASMFTFEKRPFFEVIEYVNPRDAAMTAEWARRIERISGRWPRPTAFGSSTRIPAGGWIPPRKTS